MDLLRLYAETIENLTLESNGVVTFTPDSGDAFNPRMHRRVGGEPTADAGLSGHIAGIRRWPATWTSRRTARSRRAEVIVFAVTKGEQQ